jgi:hypothetical protein
METARECEPCFVVVQDENRVLGWGPTKEDAIEMATVNLDDHELEIFGATLDGAYDANIAVEEMHEDDLFKMDWADIFPGMEN